MCVCACMCVCVYVGFVKKQSCSCSRPCSVLTGSFGCPFLATNEDTTSPERCTLFRRRLYGTSSLSPLVSRTPSVLSIFFSGVLLFEAVRGVVALKSFLLFLYFRTIVSKIFVKITHPPDTLLLSIDPSKRRPRSSVDRELSRKYTILYFFPFLDKQKLQ